MAASSRRSLAIVFAVVFLDLLGFGIIIPILPYYTRSFPGGTELVIGMLAASYSLMQFVFAPLLGSLSDRIGRRPVLVFSLCGSVIAWTVFGLADALWLLFVSRLLAGAMGGNLSTAQAYVADVTPSEDRAASLGLLGAAFGLGFIFGPGIGAVLSFDGVVAAVDGVVPVVAITRFSLPSFAAALASLAGVVVTLLFLPESLPPADRGTETETRPSQIGRLRAGLRTPGLRALLAAFFLVSFAFSGVQIMFIPFVADIYGYTASQSALLLTYVGVLSVVVQGVLIGRLTARYAAVSLTVGGTAILALGTGLLPFTYRLGALAPDVTEIVPFLTGELLALLAVLTLLPLGNGVLSVTLTTIVSKQASAATQGSAFGLTQGAGSLARTVGPVVMGGLYAAVGYWSPFVLGAVVLVPVGLLVLHIGSPVEPPEPRPVDPGHVR